MVTRSRCAFSMRSPMTRSSAAFEQLALADVLQIHADEIDLLASRRGARLELFLVFLLIGTNRLVFERLGSSS
jgi:hypothetical protein